MKEFEKMTIHSNELKSKISLKYVNYTFDKLLKFTIKIEQENSTRRKLKETLDNFWTFFQCTKCRNKNIWFSIVIKHFNDNWDV